MELNQRANIREYLMILINNLSILTPNHVKLQSSILSKLTQTTNELTRKTSVLQKIFFFFILFLFKDSCLKSMFSIISAFEINRK